MLRKNLIQMFFSVTVVGALLTTWFPVGASVQASKPGPFPEKPCWELFAGVMNLLIRGNSSLGIEPLEGIYPLADPVTKEVLGYIMPVFGDWNMSTVVKGFNFLWHGGVPTTLTPSELSMVLRSWAVSYPLEARDVISLFKEDFQPCGGLPAENIALVPYSQPVYSDLPFAVIQLNGETFYAYGVSEIELEQLYAGIGADVLPVPTSLPAGAPARIPDEAVQGLGAMVGLVALGVMALAIVLLLRRPQQAE